MPVNRFETPLVAQHQQTYVSQFVPLPFEQIQKQAEVEQAKHDYNKEQWGKLIGDMGETLLIVDNPIMQDKVNSIYKNVDSQIEAAGGDMRYLNDSIQRAARDYKEFITTGPGALGLSNKKASEDYKKRTEDSKIGDYWAPLAKAASDKKYVDNGALAKNQKYEGMALWTPVDYRSILIKDVLPRLISDEKQKSYYDIDEENGLVVNINGKIESVKSPRIKDAFSSELKARPEFKEMIESQYNILKELGQTGDVTLDDYKNAKINQIIQGYENFAYEKENKSVSTHERPGEGERVKKVLEFAGPTVEVSSQAAVTDKDLAKIQNIKQYKEQIDKMAYNPFSDMKTIFLQEGLKTGKSEPQWNSALSRLASKSGINILKGTADNYFKLQQQLVNGYLTKKDLIASGVAGNEVQADKLMRSLQANYYQRKNYDRAFIEAAEGMVRTGNLTQAEYDKLEKHFDTVYSNVDVRKKQEKDLYTFRGTKDYGYEQTAKQDPGLADIYAKMEKAGISKNILDRVAHSKSAKANVTFTNALPIMKVVNGVAKPLSNEESVAVWGELFKKIADGNKDALMNMQFTATDPESLETYKTTFADILEKEYQKDPILMNLRGADAGGLSIKVGAVGYNKDSAKSLADIEERKKEIYDAKVKQLMVMEAYEPGTNNIVIGIPSGKGETYTSSMDPNKPNSIYSSIEQYISKASKNILAVNSKKLEAIASPVTNYEAFPGIFISDYGANKQTGSESDAGTKVYISKKEVFKKYPFLKQVESNIPGGTRNTDRIILEGESGDEFLKIMNENAQNNNKEDIERIFTVFLQQLVNDKK